MDASLGSAAPAHSAPKVVAVVGLWAYVSEFAGTFGLPQGTEHWTFMDGDQIVPVHPRGRFKGDNATALAAAAAAGQGIAWLPDGITDEYMAAGKPVAVMTRYPPPRQASTWFARPDSIPPARSGCSATC